jgi:hypothetical protein
LFCDTPSQIKKNFGAEVVAVISSDARSMRGELEHADGVFNLVLVGDGFHVILDNAERRIPELRTRLMQAQLPFDDMFKTNPTIEDLLVAAVENETAEARS